MESLIREKLQIIEEKEDEIEILKLSIEALKKGDKNVIIDERKRLYSSLRHSLPRLPYKFIKEDVDYCNEILKEFDDKFNITENDITETNYHKYRIYKPLECGPNTYPKD